MTEERKFVILFAATILAARRLIDLDPDKPNMAKGFCGALDGYVTLRAYAQPKSLREVYGSPTLWLPQEENQCTSPQ